MAMSSGGQPPQEVAQPPLATSYANILRPQHHTTTTQPAQHHTTTTQSVEMNVAVKRPTFVNGKHSISWHWKEIQHSIHRTNLQWAVLGKFKYGSPALDLLRKIIPTQCGIKGECTIGLLEPRQVLIRCTLKEDYVTLLSKAGFWLSCNSLYAHMRTLKWEPWNDPKKETSKSIAWISFPNLPPNFFATEFIFSLAFAVGNPLHADVATQKGTRPSCAKVKVEVDLLDDLPQGIEVGEHDDNGKVIDSKWISIRYDYLPKYCKTCCLQGHDEEVCYVVHPELYPSVNNGKNKGIADKEVAPIAAGEPRILTSGRIVQDNRNPNEWHNVNRRRKGNVKGQVQVGPDVQREQRIILDKDEGVQRKIQEKEPSKSGVNEGKNVFAVLVHDIEEGQIKEHTAQSIGEDVLSETHASKASDKSDNEQRKEEMKANIITHNVRQSGRMSGVKHDQVVGKENNNGLEKLCDISPRKGGETIDQAIHDEKAAEENGPAVLNVVEDGKPQSSSLQDSGGQDEPVAHGQTTMRQNVVTTEKALSHNRILEKGQSSIQIINSTDSVQRQRVVEISPPSGEMHPDTVNVYTGVGREQFLKSNLHSNNNIKSNVHYNSAAGYDIDVDHIDTAAVVQNPGESTKSWVEKSFGKSATGNVLIDVTMKKPGNLDYSEIVQTNDKSTVSAQVQYTCAASAHQQEQQIDCYTRAPVEEYESKPISETSPLIPTSQLEVICKEASNLVRDPRK